MFNLESEKHIPSSLGTSILSTFFEFFIFPLAFPDPKLVLKDYAKASLILISGFLVNFLDDLIPSYIFKAILPP